MLIWQCDLCGTQQEQRIERYTVFDERGVDQYEVCDRCHGELQTLESSLRTTWQLVRRKKIAELRGQKRRRSDVKPGSRKPVRDGGQAANRG